AIYLSVNYGGNNKLTFGRGTRLTINANLSDSDPSVYQLKSQDGELSACLITDFAPENISIGSSDSNLTEVSGSIVQVKNPHSNKMEASYGTVLWREKKSFHCIAKQKMETFEMSDSGEEGKCAGWEMVSRLQAGLWSLVVAVNLLLTIWLWKS
uniref:T-cell receptor alpha chain constant domain-containing protein n=1 Tax=Chelonoidis abingdonii TaxID=106734 RepID=A0A8C0QMA2_CHEAB